MLLSLSPFLSLLYQFHLALSSETRSFLINQRFRMEVDGKANATIFTTIPSKTLNHHHQHMIIKPETVLRREPYPDPDTEPDPDPDPSPAPVSTSPPTPPSPPAVSVAHRANQRRKTRGEITARYRECQKNHAAATGGHVVDGCGEFMPSGEEGTPDALKCAACGCHRSFHRKEIDGQDSAPYLYAHTTSKHLITPTLYCSGSYRVLQSHAVHRTAENLGRRSYSSEEMNNVYHHRDHQDVKRSGDAKGSRKKRFRTKITQEQKEKMKEFAEKLEWRMQKKDEEEVDKFCSQVNLRRQVFKVWMHNNKQAMKRSQSLDN